MRTLLVVLTMALITLTFTVFLIAPTLAQEPFFLSTVPLQSGPLPQTITLHDGRNIIGTGTVNYFPGEVRIVVRLNNGQLLGTQVIRRNGEKIFYDVNGVESAPPTFKYEAPKDDPPKPVQDALDAVKPNDNTPSPQENSDEHP